MLQEVAQLLLSGVTQLGEDAIEVLYQDDDGAVALSVRNESCLQLGPGSPGSKRRICLQSLGDDTQEMPVGSDRPRILG